MNKRQPRQKGFVPTFVIAIPISFTHFCKLIIVRAKNSENHKCEFAYKLMVRNRLRLVLKSDRFIPNHCNLKKMLATKHHLDNG